MGASKLRTAELPGNSLLSELSSLRDAVAVEGRAAFRACRRKIERRRFAVSALNFAHYLALRRYDLRPLQRQLMARGLSSLGRSEGRVLANLDAVATALAALEGRASGPRRPPQPRQFFRGQLRLAAETELIFGARPAGRPGYIMVTLATEAAAEPELVRRLAEHGADALRINCAHDDPATWKGMIANARAAEAAIGRRLCIFMDLAGPRIRTADVSGPPDRPRLTIGSELLLRRGAPGQHDESGFAYRAGCTIPAVVGRLGIGAQVLIDEGKLRGTIVRAVPAGLVVRFEGGRRRGLLLADGKGLNFPGVDLGVDPVTDHDRAALDFVVAHADGVGLSFVESAAHLEQLQDALAARRTDWRDVPLIVKVETLRAVKSLPEIIIQGAGRQPLAVMIARGDLAAELGFERLAEIQEEILWLCEAAHVPAIWATQVLEDLVKKGLPSRGEMTDAAMAGRAECVMLNKGPNIVAAVDVLDRLLRRMSEHQFKKTPMLRALKSWIAGQSAPATQARPPSGQRDAAAVQGGELGQC